jgi:putative SOS response-associated peptidase YedK
MCYDMSFFSPIRLISDYLELPEAEQPFTPTYHQVAPSFCRWPVAIGSEKPRIELFEWGVIADYMNTPEKIREYRTSMANARSEKILGDPRSVWHRIRHQRCLVFTTGFFEHRDIGEKRKLPYFIRMAGVPVFALGGLYNYSPVPDPETGELKGTFAVITRAANPLMRAIHNSGSHPHRMPLILPREQALTWLRPDLDDRQLGQLLDCCVSSEAMEAWPVNSIRRAKPDDATVIRPLEEAGLPPLTYG